MQGLHELKESTMDSSLYRDFSKLWRINDSDERFLPFTPCFRHAISLAFHLFFLLLLVPISVFRGGSKAVLAKPSSILYKSCLVCSLALCILFAFLSVFNYFTYWNGGSLEIIIIQVDFLVQIVSWFAISGVLKFRVSERKFPNLLTGWWMVFFFVSLYGSAVDLVLRSYVLDHYVLVDFLSVFVGLFFCYACLFGDTGIDDTNEEAGLSEPLLKDFVEKKKDNVTPYANASVLSRLTFSWLTPLFSIGTRKTLNIADVPELANEDSAKFAYPLFKEILFDGGSEDASVGKRKLVKALFFSVWKEVAWTALLCLITTCASYVGPYMIDSLVQYLSGDRIHVSEGYFLISTFLVATLVQCISQIHWLFMTQQIGIRNRAALTALIYEKGLSLSSQARKERTSGEIVNLMSIDAERISSFSWYIHDLWVVPVEIILALMILYNFLGLASIAALLASFVVMVVNIPLGKLQKDFQEKVMKSKDERMKETSEILKNMRILKLQGWELRFLSKIMDLRKTETSWMWKCICTFSLINFLVMGAPTFISVAAFAACMPLGISLTTGRVLSALATLRMLQGPIFTLPETISMIVQTKVSIDRIVSFLHLGNIQQDAILKSDEKHSSLAIDISNGVFSWDPSSDVPTLRGLNLQVHHGMKVAVCGIVGSGKTSLLSCILGELPKISGTLRLSGTTAYVAQSPWIQSGKIEENILFGNGMDRERYEHVLDVCSLRRDLEILPLGDQTIIGERGINLSGGQKQRVQIARALYQDADIYLFDDPFSAVDAHTGSHLFQECLHRFLNSKTVIYVTHQVEFLTTADLVLVMVDGMIAQAGQYDSILSSGTDFIELVGAHKNALSAVHSMGVSDVQECSSNGPNKCLQKDTIGHGSLENGDTADETGKLELVEENRQIVQEEERETGRVGFSVYWEYITAAYSGALVPFILLVQITFQLLKIGSNYWMAWATPVSDEKPFFVSEWTLIFVYVLLSLASSVFNLINALLIGTTGFKTATILFNKMHMCIFRSPMSFFDATPTGRILNRVSSDQNTIDFSIPYMMWSSAFAIIQLLGTIAMMSQITWQIFIIFIPVFAASVWLQQYYLATARELSRLIGICRSPQIQHFAESISGSATIRGFNQESRFMNKNLQLIDGLSRPKFHSSAAVQWLWLRLALLSSFTFAFSLIFVIFLPEGIIGPGIAGLVVTYGLSLNSVQSWVIQSMCSLENIMISVERILQYTRIPSEPPLVIETSRPSTNWPSHGEINIVELQARYAPHQPLVLRGLTCTFRGGSKIGIVGRTGSGKSTLVQTLFRIIDPSHGRIMIDEVDICTIGLHDLRCKLSIIPQEPTMFNGTIRSNLDPLEEYTDEQIWEALDKCQLGEVIRQRESKLDSIVNENGENWSVGQRQLVCLGRVLLKKSRILVLDEATASVDTATDGRIQQTLRQHFSNCTIIMIAHRIVSVLDSNMVLVLDNGIIAEYDSPGKLQEDKSSAFARLVAEYTRRSRAA